MTSQDRAPADERGHDRVSAQVLAELHLSRELGFLGPGPLEAHVSHALAFARVLDEAPARALDLGAGGGLPGLVLAALTWPQTRWTFLDAQQRRTDFLREAVERLGLGDRVSVLTERAEVVGRDPDHRAAFDLVAARSFGAPAVTAECAAPLLVVGGALVVSEPPSGAGDRWPSPGLATLGLGPVEEHLHDDVHLVLCRQEVLPGERYPRRVGQPAKRPLF